MAESHTSNPKGNITLFHCNTRSIRKNLNLLLSSISRHGKHYDVIAATETWLRKDEAVTIPGYKMISQPRASNSRGGGVAFFVKNGLRLSLLSELACSLTYMEALFVKIECSVVVGVVYRPPNADTSCFFDKLEGILSTLARNGRTRVIILGDINIDAFSGS